MSVKGKIRKVPKPSGPRLVHPGCGELKSGCMHCSLLPWSPDFVSLSSSYQRAADKIVAKEPEGHTVASRALTEEWSEVDVLFVGDVAGTDDDRQGLPFAGRTGHLLRKSLESVFEGRFSYGVTNLVRCRPPRNRKVNKTEVKSCSPELVREIQARKPKLVVALGNESLSFLAGQTGITMFNGRVLDCVRPEFPDLKVVGCLHPAYVLRFDHELDAFLGALEVASQILGGTYEAQAGVGEYFTLTDLNDVNALLCALRKGGRPVYYDTETGSLNWWQAEFPHLLCISFADEPGFGFTIPVDHVDSPWRKGGPKDKERPALEGMLREFFADASIDFRAQNAKFDAKHIRSRLKVEPRNVKDTMLTHLVLDEKRGTHGLKTLAYAYTGMGGYETALDEYIAGHREADPEREGSFANIPGELLFRYAAMDADVTCRADQGMREEPDFIEDEKLQRLADVFLPALSDALADIEFTGAQIDTEVVEQLSVEYEGEMQRLSGVIDNLPEVQAYCAHRFFEGKEAKFNPRSTQQLQTILFDPRFFGQSPVSLTKTGLERLALRYQNAKAAYVKVRKGSEPSFTEVVQAAIQKGEWQHFGTDAEVLQVMEQRGNTLAQHILDYRAVSVLSGTFLRPLQFLLDPKGRIHGQFMPHGTVTGRLASRDPNLQNIPNKDGGKVKRAYVSRFGDQGLIGQADFSQVELRVAACWFNEPTMIEAYLQGADVHTLTAMDISGFTPREYEALDSNTKKAWRTRAKRINFGILYGGGPPALVNTLKKDGVFITESEAQDLIDRYFKVRPALKKGIEALERSVERTGYLESFTGRRRRVPEVRSVDEKLVARALRQSVNFPIQSGASDMTLMSLVKIWRVMRERGYKSKIILTVHDSIVFDLHVSEFAEVMGLAKQIMESLPTWSDEVLPGLDWSWLRVPVVADVEVGPSWGTLVDFNPEDFDVDELWERMAEKLAA